jgi:hypothetical protein
LNLHGWADGDPFYVNYMGHPIQGAVAGRIWQLNDPRYNKAEFGRSRAYWKGKPSGSRTLNTCDRARAISAEWPTITDSR